MIHNLPKFVRFLTKYGITAHEFMLPYMLYLDERVEINGTVKYPNDPSEGTAIANLYRYSQNVRGWTSKEINNLEQKGLIENRNRMINEGGTKRRKTSPDMMSVTDLFCDEIFAPETRWDEFVQAYPTTVPNFHDASKPEIPLQMVSEPGAWEALENFYLKVVKTQVLHEQVLDLVKWGREQGYINMNISKFVSSRHWNTLKTLRQQQSESTGYGLNQL